MESKAKNMHLTEAIISIQKRFRLRMAKRPKKVSLRPSDMSVDTRRKIVKIQSHLRGFIARSKYSRARKQFVVLQSRWWMRRSRDQYRLKKAAISSIFAIVKGWATRRSISRMRQSLFDERRRQILLLWGVESASLFYRSEFWMRICDGSATFFRLRLLGEELTRLYGSVGPSAVEFGSTDFWKRYEAATGDVGSSVRSGYAASKVAKGAAEDLMKERRDVYTYLKVETSSASRDSMYASCGLHNPKKRKQALSESLWTGNCTKAASTSAVLVTRVFGDSLSSRSAHLSAKARVAAMVHKRLACSLGSVAAASLQAVVKGQGGNGKNK